MSALAIILTAAMAIPGNGPEMELGEVAETQRLDLSGEWEGLWEPGDGTIWQAELEDCRFEATRGNGPQVWFQVWEQHITDEGGARIRIEVGCHVHLGIYKQQNDRIVVCYGKHGQARPTSFRAVDGQSLLMLHRVKPRK